MHRSLPPLLAAGLAVGAFALSSVVNAAPQRTFVASNGNDANPCSITQPCRGFAAAVAKTNSGGEVIVLDSAGYGSVTITQSVSIIAPSGVYAGISVSSGNGITINGADIKVRLRGLQVNGLGGATGIFFQQGTELVVEDSTITNMGDNGIDLRAPNSNTIVSGTAIRANVNSGIYADAFSGPVNLTVSHSRLEANQWGLYVRQGARATLSESLVAGNTTGVFITVDNPAATAGSYASVEATTISKNGIGVSLVDNSGGVTVYSTARLIRSALNDNGAAAEVVGHPFGGNLYLSKVDLDASLTIVNDVGLWAMDSRLGGPVVCTGAPSVGTSGDNALTLVSVWPAACKPNSIGLQ